MNPTTTQSPNQCPKCREIFSPANLLLHRCSAVATAQPAVEKTARPSRLPFHIRGFNEKGAVVIGGQHQETIADVYGHSRDRAWANAELLVESANQASAVEALVEALKHVGTRINPSDKENPYCYCNAWDWTKHKPECVEARAALAALAEARSETK